MQKKNKINNKEYRYYEIIKYFKYEELIIGSYHDIRTITPRISIDYGCDQRILGIPKENTDIVAFYEIENGFKYYFKTTKPVYISSISKYKKFKEKYNLFLSGKYSHIKSDYKLEKIKIYYQIFFNETGEVEKFEYLGIYPKDYIDENNSELEEDLKEIIKGYPRVYPAKFYKENVKYVGTDYFTF